MTRLWALLLAASALATPFDPRGNDWNDKPGKGHGHGYGHDKDRGHGKGHGKGHGHDDDHHGDDGQHWENGTSPYQVLSEPMIGIPALGLPAVCHASRVYTRNPRR